MNTAYNASSGSVPLWFSARWASVVANLLTKSQRCSVDNLALWISSRQRWSITAKNSFLLRLSYFLYWLTFAKTTITFRKSKSCWSLSSIFSLYWRIPRWRFHVLLYLHPLGAKYYHDGLRDKKRAFFEPLKSLESSDAGCRSRGELRILEIGAGHGNRTPASNIPTLHLMSFSFKRCQLRVLPAEHAAERCRDKQSIPRGIWKQSERSPKGPARQFHHRHGGGHVKNSWSQRRRCRFHHGTLLCPEHWTNVERSAARPRPCNMQISTINYFLFNKLYKNQGGKYYYWEHIHAEKGTWLHVFQELLSHEFTIFSYSFALYDLIFGCYLNRKSHLVISKDKGFAHVKQECFNHHLNGFWYINKYTVAGVATNK